MRILHTSDWHLGANSGAVSRGPDHDLFLAWLTGQIEEQQADALVVAGDIFDSMQPSAEAQARYFRFLGGLRATGLRQVVVVGGNHDSAARLDAPRELLAALDIHVVGGLLDLADPAARYLVPLSVRGGGVAAVCLAVPYVNEFRLGVRTTDLDHTAVRVAFAARFSALYTRLADEARTRWPGVPLLATGHLTLGSARREDYPQEIHQVGRIESLPDSVLDQRLQYVALGHIHRPYPVAGGRAWYSGSPVALTLPEAAVPRRILRVDLAADPEGRAEVAPLLVPAFRALRTLEASPDGLLAQVCALAWEDPLPPLLYGRALSDGHDPLLHGRLLEALAIFPDDRRPALVELREILAGQPQEPAEASPVDLRELSPEEVFATLCRARGIGDTEALTAAFTALLGAGESTAEDLFAQIRGDLP